MTSIPFLIFSKGQAKELRLRISNSSHFLEDSTISPSNLVCRPATSDWSLDLRLTCRPSDILRSLRGSTQDFPLREIIDPRNRLKQCTLRRNTVHKFP